MLGRMAGRRSRRHRRLEMVLCGLRRSRRMGRTGGYEAIGSRRRVVIVGGSIGPSWPCGLPWGSLVVSSCGVDRVLSCNCFKVMANDCYLE